MNKRAPQIMQTEGRMTVEIRWLERLDPHPRYKNVEVFEHVLQYREVVEHSNDGLNVTAATQWRDVPVERDA